MEMSLKRSTLLLLTVAAMVISDQDLVTLDENQRRKEVLFGSSLTLHCSLKTKKFTQFRVAWFFNPSGSSFNETLNFSEKISRQHANTTTVVLNQDSKGDGKDTEETVLKHTLSDVTEQNRGWYFCRITAEIPFFMSYRSNGTEVIITKSMENTTYPSLPVVTGEQATVSPTDNIPFVDWWMWITLGVSAFMLIVLLVICTLLRRRRRTSREDPIYANTRSMASKQPSPRPGGLVENLKPVSSSQNLRNPSPGGRYDEGKRRHKP